MEYSKINGHTGSPSAQINLIRCLTAASPVVNTFSNTWTFTPGDSVMIQEFNLRSSAQINLNGCLEKISHSQTPTPVSPLALSKDQNVWPAQIRHTSSAPSQVSVFIQTSSVTAILNALKEKMKIYQCAMKNS